jgi:VWFA-related protein
MSKLQGICLSLLFLPLAAFAQQPAAPAPAAVANHISLDVLVTDKAGKPVAGLEPADLSLLDNNQPRKVLSFRRTAQAGSQIDPPVEAIIIFDAVNLPYTAITLQRLEMEKFLRRNGGHLAIPTSVFIFSNEGLHVQPEPSTDGNAIAAALDKSTGLVSTMGLQRDPFVDIQNFHKSLGVLSGIAENEAQKPGRKLLIWLGPGWPLLDDNRFHPSNEFRKQNFDSVVSLTRKLHDARITLYSIYASVGINARGLYGAFLKPVTKPHDTEAGHLALQVFVKHTGGQIVDPSSDLASQLDQCIADAGPYYTLTFAAPTAAAANEYHELKVQPAQPGLAARTSAGYYLQP